MNYKIIIEFNNDDIISLIQKNEFEFRQKNHKGFKKSKKVIKTKINPDDDFKIIEEGYKKAKKDYCGNHNMVLASK